MKYLVSLLLQVALIAFVLSLQIPLPTQLGLIILGLTANFWMAELLPLPVTALLIPLLAALLGVMDFKQALLSFAHPIIFLFLGGFALAAALHEHGLDKYLANLIMQRANNNGLFMVLILFSVSAFLSMWISNTATTAMMLPIALGLLVNFNYEGNKNTFVFILLGVAYSASIGGMATLVGSPPNAIAATALGLNFKDWLMLALPISVLLLPVMWGLLFVLLKPNLALFKAPKEALAFSWNAQKIAVVIIFIFTASLWIFGSVVQSYIGTLKGFDSWVAVLAIVLLHASKGLSWPVFEKNTQWGVLILFGGGLTLSAILSHSQANLYLAEQLAQLTQGIGLFALLWLVLIFVIFMTEISSNTALSALMIPTFMGLSQVMGFDQTIIVSAIALAASCAFMLPVATPPNAIVFGSGYIPQTAMMKVGLVLNLIFSLLLALYFYMTI